MAKKASPGKRTSRARAAKPPTGNGKETGTKAAAVEEALVLAAETLRGDITAYLVDRIKSLPKVWKQMGEVEQTEVINSAVWAAEKLIRETIRLVATDGWPSISIYVEKVVADGKKIVGTVSASRYCALRHMLLDAAGSPAELVITAADAYLGGEPPAPDADQPALPLAEPKGEAGPGDTDGAA